MSAHSQVQAAVKNGTLKRPDTCEECGKLGVVGHHDDYSKPLDVRWLCHGCHRRWHAANGPGLSQTDFTTTFRIDREQLDRFRAVAAAEKRTVAQQLRWMIACAIREHEEQAA